MKPHTILIVNEPGNEPSHWLHAPDFDSDPVEIAWPAWSSEREATFAYDALAPMMRNLPPAAGKRELAALMGECALNLIERPNAILVKTHIVGSIIPNHVERSLVSRIGTFSEEVDVMRNSFWKFWECAPGSYTAEWPTGDAIFGVWVDAFMLAVCVKREEIDASGVIVSMPDDEPENSCQALASGEEA